jgi:hypothetical protein
MPEPLSPKPDKPLESPFPGPAKASSIRFGLDEYDDIFSDFDPRPYPERMLSDDFLYELKRASLDREEKGLELTLQVPKERRNAAQEKVILERLKAHFRRQRKRLEEKRKGERKTGLRMIALGVVFMFLATWLLFRYKQELWSSFVVVLLEPAGWFTFWEGLNLVLFKSRETTPDLGFHRKMAGARITFTS